MNVKLDERYDLYINGTWVPASDGRVFTTTNPATGEKLAECAEATKEDVDAAVQDRPGVLTGQLPSVQKNAAFGGLHARDGLAEFLLSAA